MYMKEVNPSAPCNDLGHLLDLFVIGGNDYAVRMMPQSPFAFTQNQDHKPVIDSIDSVGSTVTITSTEGMTYRLMSYNPTGYDSGYQVSNIFENVAPGNYMVFVKGGDDFSAYAIAYDFTSVYADLVGEATSSNTSAPGADDAVITGTVTVGSGTYSIGIGADVRNVSGTPVNSIFADLAPGDYVVDIIDLITGQELHIPITVTDPVIPVPDSDFFFVPKIQSLEFVHEVIPNGCSVFQNLDNVRFCKQFFAYFKRWPYYQKVAKCDALPIQWQSNYTDHEVTVLRYDDDSIVQTVSFDQKIQNIAVESDYPISLRNHGSGKTRVYFTGAAIPVPLEPGDVFGIGGNADGFNGNYAVESIEVDASIPSQYLVINKNYGIGSPTSAATGKFFVTLVDFNVFESYLNLSLLDSGIYYVKIRAFSGTNEGTPALSEPIYLKDSHPETNLIEFWNTDSAFDVNYTTGIKFKMRVESILFQRQPGGVTVTQRNTTGELRKLKGLPLRKVLFEFYQLPPYLHEKLSVVLCDCDKFYINGVQYQTDAGYSVPKYITRYMLSNADIVIEQVGWFKTYNSSDLGGTEINQGFITENGGLLKR